jgi:hypothetical protein
MCDLCEMGFAPQDAIVILPFSQQMVHILCFWLAWENAFSRN